MESLGRGTATCGKEGKKKDFPSECTQRNFTSTSDTNYVRRSGQFAILYPRGFPRYDVLDATPPIIAAAERASLQARTIIGTKGDGKLSALVAHRTFQGA